MLVCGQFGEVVGQLWDLTDKFLHLNLLYTVIITLNYPPLQSINKDNCLNPVRNLTQLLPLLILSFCSFCIYLQNRVEYATMSRFDQCAQYKQILLAMWRKKQYKAAIKNKLEYFIRQRHFSRDTIPDIVDKIRLSPQEILKPYISTHCTLMHRIKWLILLHHLVVLKPRIRQQSIQNLLRLIDTQKQPVGIFQTILLQKMMVPYKTYLLKRNALHLKEIEPQFHSYAIINLLQLALSFTNIIFTIGRYLVRSNSFLVDFNVIMARDLSCMYSTLNLKLDEKFISQHVQLIESVNQEMYNVYYNCYFNKVVSHYAPEWIETDTANLKTMKQVASRRVNTQSQLSNHRKANIMDNQVNYRAVLQTEENFKYVKDYLKSTSTIASFRECGCLDEEQYRKKLHQNHQRKQFICYVESLIKETESNSQA